MILFVNPKDVIWCFEKAWQLELSKIKLFNKVKTAFKETIKETI
jgi:hypothetical protein